MHVNGNTLSEIHFWRENVRLLNEKGMRFEMNNCFEVEAFSDASACGYGGYVSLCEGAFSEGTEVFRSWDPYAKMLFDIQRNGGCP